ncbi:hypothetical protein QBC38DRAFT_61083 [Podospora fimiseda]|uniref:AB hydrolase-1 domain-containing protein n=1 Tax=Podospora fimiseda TaxID=252190 RepID=A0AAN6YQY1_9PEZI|nr:hypothetical protein QBC38DRAFT_61083 [Podospora fimiseda]
MEQFTLSTVPPIPRKSRERERGRRLGLDPPHAIDTNLDLDRERDRDNDVFADWTDRDRKRYADRYLRDRANSQTSPIAPASPEVISSLITSLSVISRPLSNHFESPSYLSPVAGPGSPISISFPGSPTQSSGSFGVDYGAFSKPSLGQLREEDVPLDELAASAPVIRTSKPPSGRSPLTAPKSPKSPSSRESGLRGLLSRGSSSALSRPSSKGSLGSGAESVASGIGKLTVERSATEPLSPGFDGRGLKKQKSFEGWGWKNGRGHRGLKYMSSRERLREKEADKKRTSTVAVGGGPPSGRTTPHLDPFAAESIINEETNLDDNTHLSSPCAIPTRDSSLRKTGSGAKRSSTRASRHSRQDSNTILEADEPVASGRTSRNSQKKRHSGHRHGHNLDPLRLSADMSRANSALSVSPLTPSRGVFSDTDAMDDGAPSPAIAQGRRRDREASSEANKRRSGRITPDPFVGYASEGGNTAVKSKRSSTRLKRLSGVPSPTPDKSSDRFSTNGGSTHGDHPHVAYERPPSADSIDDAVESYLCSPRLSQKIRHPQTGRVISFSEVGDPNGSAVFCCVGMGLTRYITAFYDELALTLKLRLITPDRPGVGDSEPYADGTATPLGWPDDVYAICQSLKITKFSILAHSAGAIYALATALRMPQHIRGRIHLLAPWIPPSQMNVFGTSAQTPLPPTNAIPTSQRILRALPTPILKAANSSFMTATSSSITSSLPKQKRARREKRKENKDHQFKGQANGMDNKENHPNSEESSAELARVSADENMDRFRPTVTSPNGSGGIGHRHHRSNSTHRGSQRHSSNDRVLSAAAALAQAQQNKERQELYDNRLTHSIWHLATTGANPAVDLLVCLERRHTIGFRYVDITRPVIIHHGSRDTRVPVDNVRWLGKTMRRCEVRVLEGEGHGLMASAQVMAGVLMEISQEWDEWSRVTGATGRRDSERRRGSSITGIGQAR